MGTEVSSQYSRSKSVTSTSGDTKAIAGTNDGRWRWWQQALGAGPGAQLSPPGLGSARLQTAEEGGQTTWGGREGEAAADGSAPRPCGDPRAETQQGPTRAPAQPGWLRGGGRRASLGGGRRWRGASWDGVGTAAERASRKDGDRRTSLRQARPRPGRSEPGGKKAAAESEPEESKAEARSTASPREGRPAGWRRASAGRSLPAPRRSPSRCRGAARWQRVLGRRRGLPSRMRLGSPRRRGQAAGGRHGRAGTEPRRPASAPDCCWEEGRGPGQAGRREAEVRHPRHCLSPGSAPPSRPAGRPRGPRGTRSLPRRDRWRGRH